MLVRHGVMLVGPTGSAKTTNLDVSAFIDISVHLYLNRCTDDVKKWNLFVLYYYQVFSANRRSRNIL